MEPKPKKEQILIVEDDLAVIQMLQGALRGAGYAVRVARDGKDALRLIQEAPLDLILLDVSMPRMDGWETLGKLRKFSDLPVIMLTGYDTDQDQVRGLEGGADDYITKPASVAVIRARVRAVLRRRKQPPRPAQTILTFDEGALIIDQSKAEVIHNGQPAALTPTEYRLLMVYVSNAGHTIPHEEVLAAVWGPGYEEPELVRMVVMRVRNKIEPDPQNPRYLQIRRGQGYYFDVQC